MSEMLMTSFLALCHYLTPVKFPFGYTGAGCGNNLYSMGTENRKMY